MFDETSTQPVPLEAVLRTPELASRSARAADHRAESEALLHLARHLADSPRTILAASAISPTSTPRNADQHATSASAHGAAFP